MKKLLIFFLFLHIVNLQSQEIYVSSIGKDKNDGTKNNPVYSLQAAFNLAKTDTNHKIIIHVASGNYLMNEPLILDDKYSRNVNNKIQVIGNKKKSPIFFGGKKVTPTINPSTKYWEIDISDFKNSDGIINFFTVDGVQRNYSRFPDDNFIKATNVSYTNSSIIVTIPQELNEILKKYSPSDIKNIVVTFYTKWTNLIKYIDNYDHKNGTITFTRITLPDMYKIVANETRFKINNIKQKLKKGEWYIENGKIIYNPFSSEGLTSLVVIPTINKFIKADGNLNNKLSYIEFENLSYNTAGSGLLREGYYPYQAAALVDAAFEFKYCDNLKFKNFRVNNISNYAFWFQEGCANIKVLSSIFSNLGAGAIKIGNIKYSSDSFASNSITIDNNLIKKGGLLYPDAVSIHIINAFSNTISHNDISDFTSTGISLGWVWGYGNSLSKKNVISYNHIYNIGKGELDDMGGIYTLGISEGTILRNNVIHDVNGNNYGGWGIYTDEGSSNILIENNLVYNCKSSGFHQHYGKNNTIRNNIFAFNVNAELEATKIEDHNSFNFINNIVVHNSNNFFAANWLNVKKNSNNNIYYCIKGSANKNLILEKFSWYTNPELQKKDFYYEINNKDIIEKINFKNIDFSKTGIYKD